MSRSSIVDRYQLGAKSIIDVLMLTLDADKYLETCLNAIYKYIPVNELIVCDGGSKDKTYEIFDKYPRVKLHKRPDIRTTGKGYEFLFNQCKTDWFALIDSDVEITEGWYEEMVKYHDKYDFYECKRIISYHFNRVSPYTINPNERSLSGCQMGRREAFKNYHVDDDYIWRSADLYAHQFIVKEGHKYGKVSTTYHYHHSDDDEKYSSDPEKIGPTLIFQNPTVKYSNRNKWLIIMKNHAKALIKYLDPEFHEYHRFSYWLNLLDKEYIINNNPKWLKYYKPPTLIWRRFFILSRFFLYFTRKYILNYPKELKKAYKSNIPLQLKTKKI